MEGDGNPSARIKLLFWVQVPILFPCVRAAFGNMAQADMLFIHLDNSQPVQFKCGFDGVHQFTLAQWCIAMEPDRRPVEFF